MAQRRDRADRIVEPEPCCPSLADAPLSEADADTLARAFAALADPVRLRLLSLIADAGEVCSCDLLGPLGRSQPTVSHHTKTLAEAGLIIGEKRGRWVWWSIVPGAHGRAARRARGWSARPCLTRHGLEAPGARGCERQRPGNGSSSEPSTWAPPAAAISSPCSGRWQPRSRPHPKRWPHRCRGECRRRRRRHLG